MPRKLGALASHRAAQRHAVSLHRAAMRQKTAAHDRKYARPDLQRSAYDYRLVVQDTIADILADLDEEKRCINRKTLAERVSDDISKRATADYLKQKINTKQSHDIVTGERMTLVHDKS